MIVLPLLDFQVSEYAYICLHLCWSRAPETLGHLFTKMLPLPRLVPQTNLQAPALAFDETLAINVYPGVRDRTCLQLHVLAIEDRNN
jgi:hypothetical protein